MQGFNTMNHFCSNVLILNDEAIFANLICKLSGMKMRFFPIKMILTCMLRTPSRKTQNLLIKAHLRSQTCTEARLSAQPPSLPQTLPDH